MGTDVISIYVFIQFFENISVSLDESAYMDGASYFTIFYRNLVPAAQAGDCDLRDLEGRRHLQRVLQCDALSDKTGFKDGITGALYLYRTFWKPVQSHLCGRYHDTASGADYLYRVPESDLFWSDRRRSQRLGGLRWQIQQ